MLSSAIRVQHLDIVRAREFHSVSVSAQDMVIGAMNSSTAPHRPIGKDIPIFRTHVHQEEG